MLGAAARGAAGGSIAVLGGARLTNESAYAWAKLAKDVLGTDNVAAQLGHGPPADLVLGLLTIDISGDDGEPEPEGREGQEQ